MVIDSKKLLRVPLEHLSDVLCLALVGTISFNTQLAFKSNLFCCNDLLSVRQQDLKHCVSWQPCQPADVSHHVRGVDEIVPRVLRGKKPLQQRLPFSVCHLLQSSAGLLVLLLLHWLVLEHLLQVPYLLLNLCQKPTMVFRLWQRWRQT